MKYDRTKTIAHPLSVKYHCCLKDFNRVVYGEDKSLTVVPHFVSNIEVLNLDCVEIKRCLPANIPRNQTMDITFAISENNKTEMILVEFKLNMENPNNLTTAELEGKVTGSINLLGHTAPIHNQYIFVFQPNKKAQAENKLYRRMNGKIPNNYKAMDIESLIKEYIQ